MDCFHTRYYRLNRRMLILMGQWPYQDYSHRVKVWIVYVFVMITGIVVQVARAVKAEQIDWDLRIEFISQTLAGTVLIIRYFSFTVANGKVKQLLDDMKRHWVSFTDDDEYEIFREHVRETTTFVGRYAMYTCLLLAWCWLAMLSSPFLVYTPFFNDSCPMLMMYSQEFILDPHDYCFVLLLHICIFIGLIAMGCVSTDTMYMVILFHASGLFKVVCYRLEHAFDDYIKDTQYTSGRSNVQQRIASAVDCHRIAIRFSDDISAAFAWANVMSLMLTMLSIGVALYWAAMSKEESFKVLFAVVMAGGSMIHLFFMDLPSQTMLDNSEAVIFKAYCGVWYMAPPKEQTLLLLAMQRGLKPSAMVTGKLHLATLENYAGEVQASFSYFTLLLSLQ